MIAKWTAFKSKEFPMKKGTSYFREGICFYYTAITYPITKSGKKNYHMPIKHYVMNGEQIFHRFYLEAEIRYKASQDYVEDCK